MDIESFPIEVAYANQHESYLLCLKVRPQSTIREAIESSGILLALPKLCLESTPVGIWSKIYPLHHFVQPFDRVEIYHPLMKDAETIRQERLSVKKQKSTG